MKAQAKNWGDGLAGLAQERAKQALLGLDPKHALHVKNWKPQVLILGSLNEDGVPKETGLIALVNQLKKSNGLSIFGACRVGETTKANFKRTKEDKLRIHDYFRLKQLEVFSNVVLASTARKGLKALIQAAGLGGLEPNTVLLPWPENWESQPLSASRFCKLVRLSQNCGMAAVSLRPVASFDDLEKQRGSIDIWWFCYDGGLMCLLAYLLLKGKYWKHCSVRLISVLPENEGQLISDMPGKLADWISKYRVFPKAACEVVTVPIPCFLQFSETLSAAITRREDRLKSGRESTILDGIEQADATKLLFQPYLPYDNAAAVLNSRLQEVSGNADLVITVLPDQVQGQGAEDYLRFCDAMLHGLRRVMLVKGTDDSVVTDYT
jgi:potassium/chloride transporter 4/5/6